MLTFILKIWNWIKKYLKWILLAIAVAVIASLAATSASRGQKLKKAEIRLEALEQQSAGQQQLIEKLAAMESVHCEVTLTVKNTAVMGSAHSGAVSQEAEQVATYLRGEVLEKMLEEEREPTTKENPDKKKKRNKQK